MNLINQFSIRDNQEEEKKEEIKQEYVLSESSSYEEDSVKNAFAPGRRRSQINASQSEKKK